MLLFFSGIEVIGKACLGVDMKFLIGDFADSGLALLFKASEVFSKDLLGGFLGVLVARIRGFISFLGLFKGFTPL